MTFLTTPTTFATATSSLTPLPDLLSLPTILPSPSPASILPSNATLPIDPLLPSEFNTTQKGYYGYHAYGSNYGGVYVKPNSTTGSEHNKTALHWPEFQTCRGVNFLVRKGNCYVVYSYSRGWQIAGVVFWGLFCGILGVGGVLAIGFMLAACCK